MTFETITYEEAEGVATLTLNRPDRLNAVTARMLAELKQALARAEANSDMRCLLLTGAGRAFCAGQDLADRTVSADSGTPDLSRSLSEGYNPFILALVEMEMPTLCAVNGVAAGAGANMALACDIVLAARSAKFLQAFAKIGLIPDSGGSYFLPRLLGLPRARALAMLAEPISADQAEEWGLIWKAVDDDMIMLEATTMAGKLARAPTLGLTLTKKAMLAAYDNSFVEQLALEAEYQGQAGRSEDYAEGVAAFMEKRQPNFKGK
jgi:2-(1,2-epoxy-1,2-dihydrophenyl)acetyl-CoA isomerase